MGLTKDRIAIYVGVFTSAKVDFKRNDSIAIAVDGRIFEGKSHGVRSKKLVGGQHGGYIITNNPPTSTLRLGFEPCSATRRPIK
jgi:hypothetical protein